MADKFVNTIVDPNSGYEYEIQDKRLTATAADAGKLVGVDAEGNLNLVDAPSGRLEIVEINASLSESEVTIEITQEQYQKLLGDNVVLKINDSENGSFYMRKTNDITEPNVAIYSNIITNVSFNAIVQQVETEGDQEYAVVISSQTLGGGTKLYKHEIVVSGIGSGDKYIVISTSSERLTVTQLASRYGKSILSITNGDNYPYICNASPSTTNEFYFAKVTSGNIQIVTQQYNVTGGSSSTDTVTEL